MVNSMDLNEIKKEALKNNVPIIQDPSLEKIKELIVENNVSNILEIGTAVGYSALSFLSMGAKKIVTIERNEEMYHQAIENIMALNKMNEIEVIFGDALDIDISHFNKEFDLLFIDAAKAQNIKLFERFSPFVKDDGIIVVDNILFHGVKADDENISKNLKSLVLKIQKFIDWLNQNEEFETVYFNEGDGLAISRRRK